MKIILFLFSMFYIIVSATITNASEPKIEQSANTCNFDTINRIGVDQISESPILKKFLNYIEHTGDSCAIIVQYNLRETYPNNIDVLEELDIALGKTIRLSPKIFLSTLKQYMKNHYIDLEGILCNYGDELDDNFRGQLKETNDRIRILLNVNNIQLTSLRDSCVQVLKEHKKVINEALQSENSDSAK